MSEVACAKDKLAKHWDELGFSGFALLFKMKDENLRNVHGPWESGLTNNTALRLTPTPLSEKDGLPSRGPSGVHIP